MSTTYVPPPPPVKNDWKPPPIESTPSVVHSNANVRSVSSKPSAQPPQSYGGQSGFGQQAFGQSQLLPAAPPGGGQRGSKVYPSSGQIPSASASGQVVPPRPKPNPAAFMDPNQILQPVKAPLRPAPSVPPRR